MKRFGEFIRQLSLSQQLAAIIFFLISFFTAFFFIYLTGSVENVIREQMYTTLETSQDMISSLYGGEGNENFTQSQLRRALTNSQMHLIVDIEDVIKDASDPKIQYLSSESDPTLVQQELSANSELIQRMMERGVLLYQSGSTQYEHGHMAVNGVDYCYSVRLMNDGTSNVLMSYMDENYAQDAKDMMINSILYITVMAFCFIFLIMMLWVVSLIHPLNQIRNYIEKVKAGKEAELHLNRKDEIGELADALVSMREELLKQEKTKEEMIHNISHDLKTPIATIKSYGESIKDGIYPYETLEKSVDVIIDNADRLEHKVHSLLYMNRVEYLISQDAEGVVTNMKEVVDKVLLNIAVIRSDVRIETDLEEIFFDGLWESWRVVVENILENALRYAQSVIVIHLNEEEGLTIANDGPSMDESRIETLFKPFEKGEGGRFGLGLSIVSKVVRANHYEVRGENTADGVIFRIFREKPKATRPERKQKNARGKSRREGKGENRPEEKTEVEQENRDEADS